MVVYYDEGRAYPEPRLHPYTSALAAHHGYEDFKVNIGAIRMVLEDFHPFDQNPAIQGFYDFLEWINGPQSHLETNDCGMRAPASHRDAHSNRALSLHGRTIILYRDLHLNASPNHTDWLCGKLMQELRSIDQEFSAADGVLGFTLTSAIQTALSNGTWQPDGTFSIENDQDPGVAKHLIVWFWAYGDDEKHTFQNFGRLIKNLWNGCRLISDDIDRVLRERSANAVPKASPQA